MIDQRQIDEWDDEDVRQAARAARTEDEYLEVLREAGGLGVGAFILRYGASPEPLPFKDRIICAQLELREREGQRAMASLPPYHVLKDGKPVPMTPERVAQMKKREAASAARAKAIRMLGWDAPALSEEWRRARGNHYDEAKAKAAGRFWAGYEHDYEAAVRAELAARALKETA